MANLPRGRPRRKPRPRKIEGVTITPTWHWSPWYAAHVKRTMKGLPSGSESAVWFAGANATPRERYEGRAVQYAQWLARRDGLRFEQEDGLQANKAEAVWDWREFGKPVAWSLSKVNGKMVWTPRRKIRRTFVRAVEFYYQAPGQRGQWWHNGWKGEPIERELIATVQIPNYDFEPAVTESERPAERRAA